MADVLNSDYAKRPMHMSAYGNAWSDDFLWNKAAVIADKLYIGVIPAGTRVVDAELYLSAALASGTLSLGFEPADGVSPAANLTYWLNAQTLAAAGRFETSAAPVTFEKAVKVVGTVGGANLTTTQVLDVIFSGQCLGTK